MRKPIEFDAFPDALAGLAPYGPYKAIVERIVDGDTIYALVDGGFNAYPYVVIRLRGINAPELHTGTNRDAGAAARDHLALLIWPGAPVVLETERDVQTFGRYVAYVTALDVDGTSYEVGARMVADGYAVVLNE